MRYSWFSALVILLDQGSKWLFATGLTSTQHEFNLGSVVVQFDTGQYELFTNFSTALSNSTSLILIAGLLATYLLISRLSGELLFINNRTSIGLQLAIGGLVSHTLDLALRGDTISPLVIIFGDSFSFETSIAHLALFAGFILLFGVLVAGNSKLHSFVTLYPAAPTALNLSRLPRGIDNIHIDVLLSPRFTSFSRRFIRGLIPVVIRELQQGKQRVNVSGKSVAILQKQFSELMYASIQQSKNKGEKNLPDLFLVALFKFIHTEVNNAVAAELQRSKEGVTEQRLRGLKAQSNSHYVQWLFRRQGDILALTNFTLIQALLEKQHDALIKAGRNITGNKHPFFLQAISSALVLSESPSNEMVQMQHYLLLGQQQSDPNSFVNLDRSLADTFAEYIELINEENDTTSDRDKMFTSIGDINSNTIDTLSQASVLMDSRNIAILLDEEWTKRKLKKHNKFHAWRKYRKYYRHRLFQQRLNHKLATDLEKQGILSWIAATCSAHAFIKQNPTDLPPSTLVNLLSRNSSRQEFIRRVQDASKGYKNPPSQDKLVSLYESLHKERGTLHNGDLLKFIHNFSRYRQDLLLLLTYQRTASQLRLLKDKSEIETSRANYSLYEFCLTEEVQEGNRRILSHVILKADLRGSTEVTQKLIELDLNPATHFDRNFFSPINAVIDTYGAEKVFIEGDALILILNEYSIERRDHLIAARACALASKILAIVAKQNRELEAYGLPSLELGIGIAYEKTPPRYLFDNQHRITISSAINRADRLSACAWGVKNWRRKQGAAEHFIEVYQPSGTSEHLGEKAQKDLVFNLNGILLEESVYERLGKELTLRPINNPLSEIDESSLYSLHLPEFTGNRHDLVIRRAPVHEYDPQSRVDSCPAVEGRYFHEVIWRPELIERLRKRGTAPQ